MLHSKERKTLSMIMIVVLLAAILGSAMPAWADDNHNITSFAISSNWDWHTDYENRYFRATISWTVSDDDAGDTWKVWDYVDGVWLCSKQSLSGNQTYSCTIGPYDSQIFSQWRTFFLYHNTTYQRTVSKQIPFSHSAHFTDEGGTVDSDGHVTWRFDMTDTDGQTQFIFVNPENSYSCYFDNGGAHGYGCLSDSYDGAQWPLGNYSAHLNAYDYFRKSGTNNCRIWMYEKDPYSSEYWPLYPHATTFISTFDCSKD